jgi:hypothetical protein
MTVGGFAAGGGLAYSFSEREWTGKLESIYRSLSFYSVAVPRYLIYRYHLWRGSPDHVWESLHRETSDMALKKILELEVRPLLSPECIRRSQSKVFSDLNVTSYSRGNPIDAGFLY